MPWVQFNSVAQLCLTLFDPMDWSMPGLPVHHQLSEFSQMYVHQVSDTIQPSHPLSSPSPPALNLSQQHESANEWALCIRWPKYWSFSFNTVLPMNIKDWFPLGWTGFGFLAIQGTLKSLLQHHGSKTSISQHSAFFMVQLSHPYMTIGKTIALTRRTFVRKIMSLLFDTLCRLVTVLPRSKCLFVNIGLSAVN